MMIMKKPQAVVGDAQVVGSDPAVLAAYFKNVESFSQAGATRARASARVAYIVAGVAVVAALASSFAVASLAPLKTVEDRVFRVDSTTGAIERVWDVQGGPMAATDAVKRAQLWNYVKLREGFIPQAAQENFDAVKSLSVGGVQKEYYEWFRGSNPDSPQVRLGATGYATVRWVSTAFLNDKQAQIRFVLTEKKDGAVIKTQPMVATIGFDYTGKKAKDTEINVNPVGFIVTNYHADVEVGQ